MDVLWEFGINILCIGVFVNNRGSVSVDLFKNTRCDPRLPQEPASEIYSSNDAIITLVSCWYILVRNLKYLTGGKILSNIEVAKLHRRWQIWQMIIIGNHTDGACLQLHCPKCWRSAMLEPKDWAFSMCFRFSSLFGGKWNIRWQICGRHVVAAVYSNTVDEVKRAQE